MKPILHFVVLLHLSLNTYSQLLFSCVPDIDTLDDSVYYYTECNEVYNYFTQQYSSDLTLFSNKLTISVDSMIVNDDSLMFRQVGVVSTNSNSGYLLIYMYDVLVHKYQVTNGEICGIASVYSGPSHRIIGHSQFRNNKIDGVLIIYTSKGDIESISKYRNGRFRGYRYHKIRKSIPFWKAWYYDPLKNHTMVM